MFNDLYGDLEIKGQAAELNEIKEKYELEISKNQELIKENKSLKSQIEVIRDEKCNLERNISILYETALVELNRKDKQIAELGSKHKK